MENELLPVTTSGKGCSSGEERAFHPSDFTTNSCWSLFYFPANWEGWRELWSPKDGGIQRSTTIKETQNKVKVELMNGLVTTSEYTEGPSRQTSTFPVHSRICWLDLSEEKVTAPGMSNSLCSVSLGAWSGFPMHHSLHTQPDLNHSMCPESKSRCSGR